MSPSTNKSETIGKIAAALAKAQGEMSHAKKDSKNPHFRSSYASLASCIEACRAPLSANEIALFQTIEPSEGGRTMAIVTTTLAHSSGEWLSGTISVPVKKDDAQGMGSALTYARRYSLCAIVGLAPDDDDDGNAASAPRRHSSRPPAPARAPSPPPAPKKSADWESHRPKFCAQLGEMQWKYEEVAKFCVSLNKPRPSSMTTAQRNKLLAWIKDGEGADKLLDFCDTLKSNGAGK